MAKYSLKEKIIFKKIELIDKATLNFKDGDFTFLITDSEWRAKHTSKIKYKSASKEKTKRMQILKRTLPQSEWKDLKYIAVPEFNRSGDLWQLNWHIIINKKVNYSEIDKTNGGLYIEVIRDIRALAGYLVKHFDISMGSQLGLKVKPFSGSHNVLSEGDLAYLATFGEF